MKKSIYVLRDELTGEVINTFLAHNDEVAKIIVERSIDKQPLLSDITLYQVAFLDYSGSNIKCTQNANGFGTLIQRYKASKNDKKRR